MASDCRGQSEPAHPPPLQMQGRINYPLPKAAAAVPPDFSTWRRKKAEANWTMIHTHAACHSKARAWVQSSGVSAARAIIIIGDEKGKIAAEMPIRLLNAPAA